jgi:hypothetical protein
LHRARPNSRSGEVLNLELELAARMAAQSCKIMLWQQSLAKGRETAARAMAKKGIAELHELETEFNAYWPARNKGIAARHWPCFKWRIADYQRGSLHFPPEIAVVGKVSATAG